MRSVLVAFAILLAILLAISALGGSLNVTEKFYEDMMEEEAEAFYEEVSKEEPENFEEDTSIDSTGPTDLTAPTAMPESTETTEEFYEEEAEEGEGEGEGEGETIEPFEEDNTFMPY